MLTTDRCIYREGILSKRGIEIPLERINTVFFHQRLIERLVKAGDLTIESAGENWACSASRTSGTPSRCRTSCTRPWRTTRTGSSTGSVPPRRRPRRRALSVADEIAKLAALRDQGHLTPAEFESQKAVLLGQPAPGPAAVPPVQPPPAPPAPPGSV